jgi:hypothetical protein
MRVFLSTDIEGTAGIADWNQVLPGAEYEMGRRLLQDEVNAAIDGALEAGATEIVVNDSHYLMQNLLPGELHGNASLLRRRALHQLPRVDRRPARDPLAHLQPELHRGGTAERHRHGRGRHQRAGRAAPPRAGRADHR